MNDHDNENEEVMEPEHGLPDHLQYDAVPQPDAAVWYDDPEAIEPGWKDIVPDGRNREVERDANAWVEARGGWNLPSREEYRGTIFDTDLYTPRGKAEYRTAAIFKDVDGSRVSFDEMAIPRHLVNNGARTSATSSEWDNREDDKGRPSRGERRPKTTLNIDKVIELDLLIEGSGYHVFTPPTGQPPGPRRVRDSASLEEQLLALLRAEGYGSILEATSTTGNGRPTDPRIQRAFAVLARFGSYAEIYRQFGPSKNTLTNWRQVIDRLPPADDDPDDSR